MLTPSPVVPLFIFCCCCHLFVLLFFFTSFFFINVFHSVRAFVLSPFLLLLGDDGELSFWSRAGLRATCELMSTWWRHSFRWLFTLKHFCRVAALPRHQPVPRTSHYKNARPARNCTELCDIVALKTEFQRIRIRFRLIRNDSKTESNHHNQSLNSKIFHSKLLTVDFTFVFSRTANIYSAEEFLSDDLTMNIAK